VACETLTTTDLVVIAGEIRGKGIMDASGEWAPGVEAEIEAAVRAAVKDIGYEQAGFHWNTFTFENHLHPQSADIAVGVDAAGNKDEGAGDQGIMFGYACNETPDLMPATLYYSHKILEKLAHARHSGKEKGLGPDAKSQVTVRYVDGKPVEATQIVLSHQHVDESLTPADVRALAEPYIREALPQG
jgi:methionine adenosyltransferase (EC 2.5.1.6)